MGHYNVEIIMPTLLELTALFSNIELALAGNSSCIPPLGRRADQKRQK